MSLTSLEAPVGTLVSLGPAADGGEVRGRVDRSTDGGLLVRRATRGHVARGP